ncbi:MAG: DUF5908 family protein [Bacteroidota bacterium]
MALEIDELEINTQFDKTISQQEAPYQPTQKEMNDMREEIIQECMEKVEELLMKREIR